MVHEWFPIIYIDMDLQNDIFAGRYRLEQRLGNGGFGEVWRALDTVTGGEVAVKIHLKENDARAAKEIVKEYTRVRDIHHDNLLTPFYVGIADGHVPYLVMELCKGDLADTDLKEPDVWRLLRDVASGLARLADNQRTRRRPDGTEVLVSDPIIHQDIKPANILLRSNGMYAISDFGISKRRLSSLSTNDIAETMESAMTIDYAAPERFPRGKGVTALESDIWSLGAMLYEVVEGHRPFAECGGDCLNPTIGLTVPAITREGYSDELKQVIYDCMAKELSARPTAAQLQDYADRVIKGEHRQRTWAGSKKDEGSKPSPSPNHNWIFIISLAFVAAVAVIIILWNKPRPVPIVDSVDPTEMPDTMLAPAVAAEAVAVGEPTHRTIPRGYTDLGLPSGTIWKDDNETGFYTYDEAVSQFDKCLPTKEQWKELDDMCRKSWTGGGYKFTGPNGNSIFLPGAGYRYCYGGVSHVGSDGYYWSSTPTGSENAWYLYFRSGSVFMCSTYRCDGLSVRLVQNY